MKHHKYIDICPSISFPSLPIVKFVLNCRAPINSIDLYHNTPLHQLAGNRYLYYTGDEYQHFRDNQYEDYTDEQMNDVEIIFNLLVNAGAHLDAVGQKGIPQDYVSHKKLEKLFQKHPIELNLKCICARIIRRIKLNYMNVIPERLQPFVQLH